MPTNHYTVEYQVEMNPLASVLTGHTERPDLVWDLLDDIRGGTYPYVTSDCSEALRVAERVASDQQTSVRVMHAHNEIALIHREGEVEAEYGSGYLPFADTGEYQPVWRGW